jgi:hypothetical protein
VRRHSKLALVAVATALGLAAPSWADDADLTDMVEIMHEEGVIDDSQYAQMRSKAERREDKKSWTDRFSMWGDFRLRWESFWHRNDAFGDQRDDRHRGRYRLRLNVRADVNDRLSAFVRLASGQDDDRSTNTTLGSTPDFGPDLIFIDRAYLRFTPSPDGSLFGESGRLAFEGGKVPDPYVWKKGRDFLLWDNDINFEGVSMLSAWNPQEAFELFFNTGYYVIDENGSSQDPGLYAAQIGAHWTPLDALAVGGRVSYFGFSSLDTSFLVRGAESSTTVRVEGTRVVRDATSGGGNTVDDIDAPTAFGLTDGRQAHVGELSAYATWSGFESWPMTLFGTVSQNFSAESVLGSGDQDLAWMVGFEVGDKKRYFLLGGLYAWLEANAFPSQFVDSDLFDGRTDRKGFALYGTRSLLSNTDLNLTVFWSKEIEDENARRVRLQGDVVVKF